MGIGSDGLKYRGDLEDIVTTLLTAGIDVELVNKVEKTEDYLFIIAYVSKKIVC